MKSYRPLKAALFLIICSMSFILFLKFHQSKIMSGGGLDFNDPVLLLFPPVDVSIYIFVIVYGCLVSFILLHLRDPKSLEKMMVGYAILLLLRMLSMTLLPLNEPKGLVPLHDPFLNNLIYPGNITTDLFFSGHIGTVFLIAFFSRYRLIYIILGLILSALLLFQHIHYSIDILMAIPVAYFVARIVNRIL